MAKPLTKNIADLSFELRDTEIFKIPDVKTRLETIRNYFFPRLDVLMADTYRLIQEVYQINPTQKRLGFVYRPHHRKDAATNKDYGEVYIGISATKAGATPLRIKSATGIPYRYSPTYLLFAIDLHGALKVEFRPFARYPDRAGTTLLTRVLRNHLRRYECYLARHHIAHDSAWASLGLTTALKTDSIEEFGLVFSSPSYYFPLTADRGLRDLQTAFLVLYPLFDAVICASRGERHELPAMMDHLEAWYDRKSEEEEKTDEETADPESINLPELASYQFVRTGLWWEVLARDRWRCRSCGRTAQEDGIVLHVDHVVPRSKGGPDHADNLQALCHKCNIGKSNRDSTDLRNLK